MTNGQSDSLGYLPRQVERALENALETFPLVILEGPRAVGKTTTALRFTKSTLRLPQDLPRLRADLSAALDSLPSPVLIDEWQLAGTELLWELKRRVDDNSTPGAL